MSGSDNVTIVLFAAWAVCEAVINLISFANRFRGSSEGGDRFSYFGIWLSVAASVLFAEWVQRGLLRPNGLGNYAAQLPLLVYLGWLLMIVGIALRLAAVATLRKQFTTTVSIVANHQIVETGIYSTVRHPAYLGLLAVLFGFGLASGNWLSLVVLVILPLAATLYRIRVEEQALLRHFGPAYQTYAGRTKRLLPGIY